MAVQKKTSKTSETKEKKEINWMQVCVVGFCVLVVVMCIFSFANFQNFFRNDASTSINNIVAEVGYPCIVNYVMKMGDVPVMNGTLGVYAGVNYGENQYFEGSDGAIYVVHKDEYNAISNGLLGHKPGDTFTVKGPGSDGYTSYLTKEEIEAQGINYDDIQVGTVLDTEEAFTVGEGTEEETTQYAKVKAVVTEKFDNAVTLQFGADSIDVTLKEYVLTEQ